MGLCNDFQKVWKNGNDMTLPSIFRNAENHSSVSYISMWNVNVLALTNIITYTTMILNNLFLFVIEN